jgi:ubiquinone/menaquinone biosynthesis C-methylase UbiE
MTLLLPLLLACAPHVPPASSSSLPDAHAHGAHGHGAHRHGGTPHDFNDAARFARSFDGPQRDSWQRPQELLALLALTPGQRVADLGAGTGYLLPHLSRAVGPEGSVVGLDVAEGMVRWMRDRVAREGLTGVRAQHVALDDPGLPAGSVDVVVTVNTWHHVEGRLAYARKIREALAPGGRLVVVELTLESPEGPPPGMRLPPEAVQRELQEAGFAARLAEEALPWQYVVIAERG